MHSNANDLVAFYSNYCLCFELRFYIVQLESMKSGIGLKYFIFLNFPTLQWFCDLLETTRDYSLKISVNNNFSEIFRLFSNYFSD